MIQIINIECGIGAIVPGHHQEPVRDRICGGAGVGRQQHSRQRAPFERGVGARSLTIERNSSPFRSNTIISVLRPILWGMRGDVLLDIFFNTGICILLCIHDPPMHSMLTLELHRDIILAQVEPFVQRWTWVTRRRKVDP